MQGGGPIAARDVGPCHAHLLAWPAAARGRGDAVDAGGSVARRARLPRLRRLTRPTGPLLRGVVPPERGAADIDRTGIDRRPALVDGRGSQECHVPETRDLARGIGPLEVTERPGSRQSDSIRTAPPGGRRVADRVQQELRTVV